MTEDSIAKEFIQKIESEGITKDFRAIICPIGLVGAGKSTVVIPLSKMLKLPRVSADDVRKILKENNLNYDNLENIVTKVAEHFLEQGYGLTFDSDCASKLDLIYKFSNKYDLHAFFIHINPPEDFIVNKLRNYKGEKWLTENQEEMVQNYFDRKELHKNIQAKIKFDYEIDTSLPNLDNKIKEIGYDIKRNSVTS